MGQPAAVLGDRITAVCVGHQVPGPVGSPIPAPPLPFAAPVTQGVATSTFVCGKPAVLAGCTGLNAPPHVGLFPADPFMAPPTQLGSVVSGSATVLVEGRPMATAASACTVCFGAPGQLIASAATVLVGG